MRHARKPLKEVQTRYQAAEEVLAEKQPQEPIRLNNQTAANLIRYLQGFSPDTKVVITTTDQQGDYHNYDCQIACNTQHQREQNTVQFTLGSIVS